MQIQVMNNALIIFSSRNERLSLENDQQVLLQEISEKTLSEGRLQDQTLLLQRQVAELEAVLIHREEELENVVRRLETVEKKSNEGKMEIVQLNANLKSMEDQKNSLDSKVRCSQAQTTTQLWPNFQIQTLEENLGETHTEFEKLRNELNETLDELSQCSQQKVHLESQVKEGKKKYEQSILQKKVLQVLIRQRL